MEIMSIYLLILLLLFAYPLFIYPIILLIIPKNNIKLRNADIKSISILISAYNEEDYIHDCIDSILKSDIQNIDVEILVGSDGSNDKTLEIANSFNDSKIRVYDFERGGKNQTINKLVAEAKHDTLLFMDADFRLKSDNIKKIIEKFSTLDVGIIICPIEMKAADGSKSENTESIYQRYESFIRRKESDIASCVNTLGSYVISKSTFENISSNNYCDDLFSVLTTIKKRKRVYFDSENSIFEVRETNFTEEYGRRERLVGGGLSTIFHFKSLLSFKYGWNSFFLWSHKVMRWYSSIFFFSAYILSLFMLDTLFGLITAYLISVLLLLSLVGYLLEREKMKNPAKLPLFFVSMNIGFVKGIVHFYKGKQNSIWGRKGLE